MRTYCVKSVGKSIIEMPRYMANKICIYIYIPNNILNAIFRRVYKSVIYQESE